MLVRPSSFVKMCMKSMDLLCCIQTVVYLDEVKLCSVVRELPFVWILGGGMQGKCGWWLVEDLCPLVCSSSLVTLTVLGTSCMHQLSAFMHRPTELQLR